MYNLTAIFSPAILILCFLILFNTKFPNHFTLLFQSLLIFYIAYILIGTISIVIEPENLHFKTKMFKVYRSYLSSILIFLVIYFFIFEQWRIGGHKAVQKIILKCSYLLIIPIIFTDFGQYFGFNHALKFAKDFGERQIGIFSNPNITGLHANFLLCIGLFHLLSNKINKIFSLIIIAAACYGIFLTVSKAAMLSMIIIFTIFSFFSIYYFYNMNLKSKFTILIFSVIISFSSFWIYSNFQTLSGNLTNNQVTRILDVVELTQGKINSQTTTDRSDLALFVWPRIKSHFILGNGLGSFQRLVGYGLGVHNTFLMVLGESGFFAILLFLLFIFYFYQKCLALKDWRMKFLILSMFTSFLFIAVLTSHNALEERMSNVLLAIFIPFISLTPQKQNNSSIKE